MKEKLQLNKKSVFLLGCFVGALIFISIYGAKVLNFTYDDWLMLEGDLPQHYIGWRFYRESNWNFPIGLMDSAVYPFKISVMYMDSIPIFAIIFKIFSPILPKTFQYFGLWGIISFMLQGGISALIIRKYTRNICLCVLSSIFFIVSPILIFRMFAHTALAGQWIILLCIYVYLDMDEKYTTKKKIIVWSLLACISVTIHMYFMPMVMIFSLCYWLKEYMNNKNLFIAISGFIIPIALTLLTLFTLGAFYGDSDVAGGGLGLYSANINAIFNPQGFSCYLKDLPLATNGQYEGMAYLGLGVILLGTIVLYIKVLKINISEYMKIRYYFKHSNKFTLLIAIIIFFILAWSPQISINNSIILNIKYPDFVFKILSIFRASGRFMWPICYLIIIYIIKELVVKNTPRQIFPVILACCILQVSDLSGILKQKNNYFGNYVKYDYRLKSEAWDKLVEKGYKNIVFLDSIETLSPDNNLLFALSKYAIDNKLTLNDGYMARKDSNAINNLKRKYLDDLNNGYIEEDTIYVIKDNNVGNDSFLINISKNSKLNYYDIDGVLIAIKGELSNTKEVVKNIENGLNILPINSQYLQNGNDTSEGRILTNEGISFGPYINLEVGEYEIEILGDNLDKSNYDICYNQAQSKVVVQETFKDNKKIIFKFNLNSKIEKFECRVFNHSNENLKIERIIISK